MIENKKFIPLLLLLLLAVPSAAAAKAAPASTAQPSSPLSAEFWLARLGEDGPRLIATPQRLEAINEHIRKTDPLSVDLASYPALLSGTALRQAISDAAADALTEEGLWQEGRPVTPAQQSAARLTLALDQQPAIVTVQWAVTTQRANLRCLPTLDSWYDPDDPFQDDWLQSTAVDPGEPVAVLAENSAGWKFVQMRHYRGWLSAEALAFTDHDLWLAFARPEKFLIVTANQKILPVPFKAPSLPAEKQPPPAAPKSSTAPADNILLFQMGSRLPLLRTTRTTWEILLPAAKGGQLTPCRLTLPRSDSAFHEGYLPYTAETLIRQSFLFLGNPYGWGGLNNSVDCSAFTAAIYRTVGLELPRDSDSQEAIIEPQHPLTTESLQERYEILQTASPGSLLFLSGHVMMYLGLDDTGVPLVIHALSRARNRLPDGSSDAGQPVRRVVVSGLTLPTGSGRTFFAALTSIGLPR